LIPISTLYERLTRDTWRDEHPFSERLAKVTAKLHSDAPLSDRLGDLAAWLSDQQPCLFGTLAARSNAITYCLITADDIKRGDLHVREVIQRQRVEWTRDGLLGKKSAFVLLASSPELTTATPDEHMLAFAQRLCSLYLLVDAIPDTVHLDELYLEIPGHSPAIWKWHSGVNFFAASADGRWWQDHRIPGGIGFSVNSVGHFVRSGQLSRAWATLQTTLGETPDKPLLRPESLQKALELAMRTIAKASNGPSGKATQLQPKTSDAKCPYEMPSALAEFDCRTYKGQYHTDETIPSIYFHSDVTKPGDARSYNLDFTYLFDDNVSNPAYVTMGKGRRIRATVAGQARENIRNRAKIRKMEPVVATIATEPRLQQALDLK